MPITGLIYEKFPAAARKYVVVMTTLDRMYQFIGNVADGEVGIFGELFRQYDMNPSTTSFSHGYSETRRSLLFFEKIIRRSLVNSLEANFIAGVLLSTTRGFPVCQRHSLG